MSKRTHPYSNLPDIAFWRRAVAKPAIGDVDPVGRFELKITPETSVATAGSCFAQHIARHLKMSGFNYYVAEQGHPLIDESIRAKHNYGMFSARYGNIYTARQLRQLIERVEGTFLPAEGPWIDDDGTVRDPFRPAIQPGNFISVEEMEADRAVHLRAVKTMFETLDVFVFTLGLTECWIAKADGAAFPLCPGVEGGVFDESRYAFHNQTAAEVVTDMEVVLDYLARINPKASVILTVSPVPLMATAAPGQHVLTATTYSKSVLRVAAQQLTDAHENVHYFPSYEVITGAYNRGRYYAEDLRNVTEDGVSHAMRLFFKHAAQVNTAPGATDVKKSKEHLKNEEFQQTLARYIEVECEEAALDRQEADKPGGQPDAQAAVGNGSMSKASWIKRARHWGAAIIGKRP